MINADFWILQVSEDGDQSRFVIDCAVFSNKNHKNNFYFVGNFSVILTAQ